MFNHKWLFCFIDNLIKSTEENEPRDDSDSRSLLIELSKSEVEDVVNQDSCHNKVEKTETW